MNAQFFINEIGCNFSLRKPKSEKPTSVYFVVRVRNRRIKLFTGVRVYPDRQNIKRQEAYISCRLTELGNKNNTIVNRKTSELKPYFSEYKQCLCGHPGEVEHGAIILLEQYIYKDTMKEQKGRPTIFIMKQIIEEKDIEKNPEDQYRVNINRFKRFLDDNKLLNTWGNMSLDTFSRYQQHLTEDGKKPSTAKDIIKGTSFAVLREAPKRLDIPFKQDESNLDSLELIKDKSNKELVRNRGIMSTEEQIKQLYEYQPTGTGKQIQKKVEIRDLSVLQCLVSQRISDMYKFFNDDNERDKENDMISIIQKKTGASIIIPLILMTEETISEHTGREIKYHREGRSALDKELKVIVREAGLGAPVTYEENGVRCTEPLYELFHTHTARHTFSTIVCRKDTPGEDIIIATGRENIRMLDKIYAHLTARDKSRKVTGAFKKRLGNGIFNTGGWAEMEGSEQTLVSTVPVKPKQRTDMLNHVFVNDLLLRLSKLCNKSIDITELPDTEEAIRALKDISKIDGIDRDKCRNNTQLRDKIVRVAVVVWFITLKRDDTVSIQISQSNIAELGLKNIFFNEDVMKEPEFTSLLKPSEKALRFVEILSPRNAKKLEEHKKRNRGR